MKVSFDIRKPLAYVQRVDGKQRNTKTNMKALRIITIISGRPEDAGKRIKVGLFKSGEGFRWFGGTPGESPRPVSEQDTEVSGKSVNEACEIARKAWAGSNWGLVGKSLNF